MVTFSLYVSDVEVNSLMGWQMIIIILINCLINATIITGIGGKGIYLIIKKYKVLAKYHLCGIGTKNKVYFDLITKTKLNE